MDIQKSMKEIRIDAGKIAYAAKNPTKKQLLAIWKFGNMLLENKVASEKILRGFRENKERSFFDVWVVLISCFSLNDEKLLEAYSSNLKEHEGLHAEFANLVLSLQNGNGEKPLEIVAFVGNKMFSGNLYFERLSKNHCTIFYKGNGKFIVVDHSDYGTVIFMPDIEAEVFIHNSLVETGGGARLFFGSAISTSIMDRQELSALLPLDYKEEGDIMFGSPVKNIELWKQL